MKKLLGPVMIAFLAVVLGHFNHGCKPATGAAEVNAAYVAETGACVEHAQSKAESRSCRAGVNQRYGLCEVPAPKVPCPEKK